MLSAIDVSGAENEGQEYLQGQKIIVGNIGKNYDYYYDTINDKRPYLEFD